MARIPWTPPRAVDRLTAIDAEARLDIYAVPVQGMGAGKQLHNESRLRFPDAPSGADFITGKNSDGRRVFLDGEPLAGCLFASTNGRWAIVVAGDGDAIGVRRTLHGEIAIRATRY